MRVPVPEEFLFDMGVLILEQKHFDVAITLIIQYNGYLRPSECLGLIIFHVNPPHGHFSLIIAPATLGEITKTGSLELDFYKIVGTRESHQINSPRIPPR